jgi:hypothetical protein
MPTAYSEIPHAHAEHRLGALRTGLDPNRAASMNNSMTSSDHLMLI